MEITILLFLPCFFTVKASVVRSDYVAVARTRDAARSFCQTTYHQGTLAKWNDIVNNRSESYQVWDGNSYQLSSLITIKDCTNDTGNTQYVLPDGLHWLDTAAQCQALCGTTTFATRGSFCHCLNESYTPTSDTDCIPMLQKPAALNIRNTEAKTVFQTVTREISSNLSKGRCLAANESDTGQTLMLKRCGDTLNMLCKGGTRIESTWKEAAFGCAAANSFPQPVPEECTIGSSGWLGGFRSLQYVPGSTVGTFCKRLSYSKDNPMPRFKEVSCNSSSKFYCIYNESGYNEICDVTKLSSCDTTLICSDRSGTARCLCSDDKYWYEKHRICMTKKTYGQTCDVNVTGICQEKMSCQPRAGEHMCDCNEQHYWDVMVLVCQPGYSYNATCLPGPEDSCIGDLKCKTFRGGHRCLCDQDALYDGNICQQVIFSAVPTNMSMAFDEANRTCSATSTYLADDNNFDEIFKDCVGNTVLFQAVIPQPESVDNHCVSMRMINGTVQRNEPTTCSAKLPFVCIQKANLSTNNVCRIVDNSNVPGSEEQHDESSNSSLVRSA